MAEQPNDGGTAYPAVGPDGCSTSGMSLRAYFAGLAMQGTISGLVGSNLEASSEVVARGAVRDADALIAELSR